MHSLQEFSGLEDGSVFGSDTEGGVFVSEVEVETSLVVFLDDLHLVVDVDVSELNSAHEPSEIFDQRVFEEFGAILGIL